MSIKFMQKKQILVHITKSIGSTEEKLLAAVEEIEFLENLIESQNLYIRHLEQKTLEITKELETRNDELSRALMLGVCLDEAKVLARKVLLGKNFCCQKLVADLLTLIYGSVVDLEELRERERLSLKTIAVKNYVNN